MTGDVVWEDPPPDGRGRPVGGWMVELMEQPGRWARLSMGGTNATNYRRHHPNFEFVARTVDGKRVLYGRYVGNGEVVS